MLETVFRGSFIKRVAIGYCICVNSCCYLHVVAYSDVDLIDAEIAFLAFSIAFSPVR